MLSADYKLYGFQIPYFELITFGRKKKKRKTTFEKDQTTTPM
jgi:hypothetical protein